MYHQPAVLSAARIAVAVILPDSELFTGNTPKNNHPSGLYKLSFNFDISFIPFQAYYGKHSKMSAHLNLARKIDLPGITEKGK